MSEIEQLRSTIRSGQPPRIFRAGAGAGNVHRPNQQFYLLPILGLKKPIWKAVTRRCCSMSQPPRCKPENRTVAAFGAGRRKPASDYRTAVVFVIDTTISMGPYIARTRDAVGAFMTNERLANGRRVEFRVDCIPR
ncbi:hypothetical protein [Chromatium okenii]|uniref:hypothetical protein n=1 Tax=Chromatium okenii TaxID=61644 RepID=UPI0011B06F9B|nr:hypothetical protein [Chromatium okenii]